MTAEKYSFERYLNVRNAYGATFSPDGLSLSFLTDISGVAEVWTVPVDLQATTSVWPEQLTFRGERVSSVTYSPVQATMLVSADIGGNERDQFYLLSQDGSEFRALTNKPEVMYRAGTWSPNGQCFVYASNERDPRFFDIYEYELEKDEIRLLWQQDSTNYPG